MERKYRLKLEIRSLNIQMYGVQVVFLLMYEVLLHISFYPYVGSLHMLKFVNVLIEVFNSDYISQQQFITK